ncbi:MAG: DUF4199 domain-containing protein [Bacteroidales bacterium]|nr:DUF4199 domain-containing protein [Bacteroidales bacterium]
MENEMLKTPVTGKLIWTESMKFGALLGIITVVLELLPMLWTPNVKDVAALSSGAVKTALASSIISVLYVIVKTAICCWLLVIFTKKVASSYSQVTSSHTFRFGIFTSLLSSLIVAAYGLIQIKMMDPASLQEAVSMVAQQNPNISADQIEAIGNKVISIMPVMLVLFTILKCAVVGVIASLIISRSIPGRTQNPFEQRF